MLLVLWMLILAYTPTTTEADSIGGYGSLNASEFVTNTLSGVIGGQMEGEISSTPGPVDIYILLEASFSDVDSINPQDCVVYEHTTSYSFHLDIEVEGDWILVIRNPNDYTIQYERSWTSTDPSVAISQFAGAIGVPIVFILVTLGIFVYIQQAPDSNPLSDVISVSRSSQVGTFLLILSFLVPSWLGLTRWRGESNGLVAYTPLWVFSTTLGESSFMFGEILNPYWWSFQMWYLLPQYFYIYMMARFYQGKTAKSRTLIAGTLSISYVVLGSILSFVALMLNPRSSVMFIVPMPVVLIIGILIIHFLPGPEIGDAFLQDKEEMNQ